MLQIFATHGSRYILLADDVSTEDSVAPETPARVLDTDPGRLYPPVTLDSIVVRNPHYIPYEAAEGELDDLLDGVEANGPPADEMGEPVNRTEPPEQS